MKCPCGKKLVFTNSNKLRKKYCCKDHFYKFRKRPSGLKYSLRVKNSSWFKKKLNVVPDNKGYIRRRINGKMRRMHIVVMENTIGRKLLPYEVVHHINGIKTDNRIANLKIMTKKQHDLLHKGKPICVAV